MIAVRMIAVGLDGTLIGMDGRVSVRNVAAMKAAERAGIQLAPQRTRQQYHSRAGQRDRIKGSANNCFAKDSLLKPFVSKNLSVTTYWMTYTNCGTQMAK
jgi:hypothetical protein